MQKQTFSAKALGNEYATGVSRPAVLTTKTFLPHQRVTTEGKAMEDEIEEFDEHPQDDMSQYQDYPYEYDY
ncbi:TPA: hypothetical protein RCG88_003961 [Enterobacter roggenkampii]|nr:hypothetical protein [Enterobacter roggenkampii]